jgi:hypothetical protein
MRPFLTAAILLPLSACAGGDHHAHGPTGIPYACADGKAARIFYEGGGYFPRARARLDYDGRSIHFAATPPTYGLRYVSEEGGEEAPVLIWSARGEEAWLHALGDDHDERELAHCTRVRAGGEDHEATPEHH